MLKKILEDMFVPEEILNNITDDDKQLIFIEIRKEQIRRYNMWQSTDKASEEFTHKPNCKGKNIKFIDDNELVKFLGERPFDKPIEEILKEETLRRAHEEAERAVLEELGTSPPEKREIVKPVDIVEQTVVEINDVSTDQITTITAEPELVKRKPPVKPIKINNTLKDEEAESEPINVRIQKSPEQKREELVKRKSTEIYRTLLTQHNILEETAKKENEELTPIWEKVAEQARQDDENRRKKAVEARKFYANINNARITDETVPIEKVDKKPPPPPTEKSSQMRFVLNAISNFEIFLKTGKEKSEIKKWFLENEWNKKRIVDKITNKVPEWFHGMISRQQTEKLLSLMEVGSFLIRVSEKCLCYVLSYKSKSKVKHILIQSKIESDQYEFVGPPNTRVFKSLDELIIHFQNNFISDINQDILTKACGQIPNTVVDYMCLIQPDSSQSDKKPIHTCAV